MRKFSFHFSETYWPVQKLSHHELVCLGRIQNLGEFRLVFFLVDFEMVDEMNLQIILFLFCCFFIIKKLKNICSDA